MSVHSQHRSSWLRIPAAQSAVLLTWALPGLLAPIGNACSSTPETAPVQQPCTAAGQVFECTQGAACPDGKRPRATCSSATAVSPCMCGTTAAPSGNMPAAGPNDGVAPPRSGGSAGSARSTGSGNPAAGSGGAPVTAGDSGGSDGRGGSGGSATPSEGTPATTTSGVWAMMGGDNRNWYVNEKETKLSASNASTLTEKWRFTVSGYPPGSPVIAEGMVFAMATGGTYAIDLETGEQVWAKTDITGTASVAYEDGFIYVHNQLPANLYKLKASDGSVVWGPTLTNPTEGCDGTSSPILGGGKVVVGYSCGQHEIGSTAAGQRGGLAAFDKESGMQAWQFTTVGEGGEDGAMVWSSVAIDEAAGVVFATTGNNYTMQGPNSDSIFAVDLAAGTKQWSKQVRNNDTWSLFLAPNGLDSDFGANPILAEIGGRKVVAAGDKASAFWVLDRKTGEIVWGREDLSSSRDQAHGGVLMNGAFDGKHFYAVSNQPPGAALLHKLDPMTGADVWPAKMYEKITWGALSLANGVLVVPNDDDLYVYNAETGDQLAMFNTGGTIAGGAAAILDGKIVVKSGLEFPLATVKSNNLIICYGLP